MRLYLSVNCVAHIDIFLQFISMLLLSEVYNKTWIIKAFSHVTRFNIMHYNKAEKMKSVNKSVI